MKRDKWGYCLELSELIRMNQLVRNGIDLEAFNSWYKSLNDEQRIALIHQLIDFATQAGVREDDIREGIAKVHAEESALVELLYEDARYLELMASLKTCSDKERLAIFNVAVFMFGLAEGRVFAAEAKASCNHWWHRDLLDPAVVQSLLNNPTSRTSNLNITFTDCKQSMKEEG